MTLYTERSDAYLTVATHCTLSLSARSNSKYTILRKLRGPEVHLSAAQKFLSEITGLCARNIDHGVCVIKLRAIDSCKYL